MAIQPAMSKGLVRAGMVMVIAAIAFLLAVAGSFEATKASAGKTDDFFYDVFFRLRPQEDMRHAEVVLVAVDDASLTAAGTPWPWPRTYWGSICKYLDGAGAKAVAFDVVFPNASYYGDDAKFAEAMNQVKVPVVFGSAVDEDGSWEPFGVKEIKEPAFGAVNLGKDLVYRKYPAELNGQMSLAEAAVVKAAGVDGLKMVQEHPDVPFLLHYYGPHKRADGMHTFNFVTAYNVWYAQENGPAGAAKVGISPEMFKGKIVVICAVALGAFDLKSAPVSDEFPGPEIQATAMENLLRQQQVHTVPGWMTLLAAALAGLGVSAGVVYPRRAVIKVAVPVVMGAAVLGLCIWLFRGETIHWLSPVKPLATLMVATPLAFGFTYFAEDRQRRFMLKALSKVVSPAVAEQLSREPERLALGTVRTEITVLFTDLANFTDLSEGLDVQDLGKLINRYLGEMSTEVFKQDGTLDKYIGDAVMAFWNAPLTQADHAARACRAALGMVRREKELHGEFAALGTKHIFTRIGINTTSVAVGFIGSEHLFNYTAMGDGVNLASRMEGANKLYGTQILISETTAALVREKFNMRRIDVLRVKGKKKPMGVFELLGEGAVDQGLGERIRGYEEAFDAYQARNWERAEKLLLEVCGRFGEDGAAEALLKRVREYRNDPPAADWDGVFVSDTK